MNPLDLTIVFPVRNEESILGAALKAVGKDFAREIVVIDSGSVDATAQVAEQHGARVLQFNWNGRFPKKRNWFLREHAPTTEWVMFVDADEWLTEEFKHEVRAALADSTHDGYWLNYTIYFGERPLKGGYPLRKLALFRVGSGEYERIDEDRWSHLDMEIHEHPILTGSTGKIRAMIDHRDMRGAEHWKRKHDEYALWEARRYLALQSDSAAQSNWSLPQRIKYKLMGTPLLPPLYFLGCLTLLGGWRDGRRGVSWALIKASYFRMIYRHIRAARRAD